MTKQEAIETIKLALSQVEWDYPLDYAVAFDMAISAMEKQDVPDICVGDMISRQNAIDAICKACSMEGDYHKCDGYPETSTWCDELVALRALPSAQPEIEERTAESAQNVLNDELISKKAAIESLMAWEEYSVWDEECLKHRGEPFWVAPSDVIKQLSSAQPEQRWIPCSERLPEPYFEVIVSDDEIVYTAIRTDIGLNGMREDHYHFEDIEERGIVHPDAWMPLPEPYREEGD